MAKVVSLPFLHELRDFADLIEVVSATQQVAPTLVEKDYWIMHCLWGLQAQGFAYELKGGTSLSKGFGVIHRFSEDIDIHITPPKDLRVLAGRNHNKPAHVASRARFYDALAAQIAIPGIVGVRRDTAFDDVRQLRSAGIRLEYETRFAKLTGVKEGVLLELGFDDTAPNRAVDISSWAWDAAQAAGLASPRVVDNRAKAVLCYLPGYTFVEKLQTLSTKYRTLDVARPLPANFLRHYYDLYCLLALPEVQDFIGSSQYTARKKQRFRQGDELRIAINPAFTLPNPTQRQQFSQSFTKTAALYYQGQPSFDEILDRIKQFLPVL